MKPKRAPLFHRHCIVSAPFLHCDCTIFAPSIKIEVTGLQSLIGKLHRFFTISKALAQDFEF
jgi:hypothetical protein